MLELKNFKRYLRINSLLSLINFFLLVWFIVSIVLINVFCLNMKNSQQTSFLICFAFVFVCYVSQMAYSAFWFKKMYAIHDFYSQLNKLNMILSLIPFTGLITLIINLVLIKKLHKQCEDVDSHEELNF